MKDFPLLQSRIIKLTALPALLAVGTLLITLLVIGLTSFAATQSRLHFQQQAELQTENLARILQPLVVNAIDKADLSLRVAAMEVEHQDFHGNIDPPGLSAFLEQLQALQPEMAGLHVVDANGIVRYGAGIQLQSRVNVADREYFISARDEPRAALIIAGPHISRITQQAIMVFARRLTRPDGSFAGVVFASINTEYFEKVLALPNLGQHGDASIRTSDLRLIARHAMTAYPVDIGSQTVSTELAEQLKVNPAHGMYVALTELDQTERTTVYHQIAPYSLYLFVGLAPEDYLAGWWSEVGKFLALAGLAIAIAFLSAWAVYRVWQQRRAAVQAFGQEQSVARAAESHSRSLIEASLDPLVSLDTDGKITDVNLATETITGLSREKLIGTEFSGYFVEAALARIACQQAFSGEAVSELLLILKHADGKTVTRVMYNALACRDQHGVAVGIFVAARDVSRLMGGGQVQERVSRALRLVTDGNNLLVRADDEQTLLDDFCRLMVERGGYLMAWVGFVEQDADKTVRPVAQSGYEDGYLNGIRVSWADTELGRGPTGSAIRLGTTQVNQSCLTDPNMAPWREAALRRGYQACMALPLKSNGSILGALTLYAIDPYAFVIDEVKLLEELANNFAYGIETLRIRQLKAAAELKLDAHRRELEGLVVERTAELAAAKGEAERANNAKSRFLAAASHDLRQPLAALSLYVASLGNKLDPADRPLLVDMRCCVASLSEMLSDLLDLSKLEAGAVTPKVSDFALSALLDKVVVSHSPAARAKGLSFRYRECDLIGRTDAVLFQRIVANLVANAIRYTERGGVLIGCRRRQGKQWLEVWDTGIGIPADKTAEIFEEFKQLGNSERNRSKGTGLGLAIVAKTAKLLNLQVRVHSRSGKGSVFAVEIPPGAAVRPLINLPYTHRPLRVALVEDNTYVAAALECALSNVGHDVVAAPSLQEVLSRLKDAAPDFVISDYRLAGDKNGFDVIATLRGRFGSNLPAIIITGDTDPAVIRRMAEKGIGVQHKPLDFEALRAHLAELSCSREG